LLAEKWPILIERGAQSLAFHSLETQAARESAQWPTTWTAAEQRRFREAASCAFAAGFAELRRDELAAALQGVQS